MQKPNQAAQAALDVLFPRRCPWCGRVIGFTRCPACDESAAALRLPAAALSPAQHHNANFLAEVWACWRYEDPVRGAVRRMKFNGEAELATYLGGKMAGLASGAALAGRFDVLAPVPLSAKALRRRGYNQALLLARPIARATGMPAEEKLLRKVFETSNQSDLDARQRLANVTGVFEAAPAARVSGRRILLVDDVITTGATLNECAKMLLAAGAASCGALCAAATPYPHAPEFPASPGSAD